MAEVKLKRVYEAPEPSDGTRILVDRLWPRGLTKAKAGIDLWLKDLSPSDALRKRFHGHPDQWSAFRDAYGEELKGEAARAAVKALREYAGNGPVTLLYAAKDEAKNNAVALKQLLGE